MTVRASDTIRDPEAAPLIACVLNDQDVWSLNKVRLAHADLIELRVDMFDRLDPDHVLATFTRAKETFGKPILGTVRSPREGGQKAVTDRLSLYSLIQPFCRLVDTELSDCAFFMELRDICAGRQTLLIGSHHDFESTPDDEFLDSLVTKGKSNGADLVKIAVTAHNRDDVVRLLLFTVRHKDRGIITMAMGKAGLPTRVIGPLFGSRITYGYLTAPSAPGQLPIEELDRLLRFLGLR